MDSEQYLKMVCGECASPFYMLEVHHAMCKRTGKYWYCPNGHARHYIETEADRLAAELATTKRTLNTTTVAMDNARAALHVVHRESEANARSAAAYKGQATRLRNKYEPKEEDTDDDG